MINNLPPESLARIFKYYLATAPLLQTYSEDDTPSIKYLAPLAVCRKWRNIALQFPDCWCEINVRLYVEPTTSGEERHRRIAFILNELQLRFEHAKDCPVNLTVDADLPPVPDVLRKLSQFFQKRLPRLRTYAETGTKGFLFNLLPNIPERKYHDVIKLCIQAEETDFASSTQSNKAQIPRFTFPVLQHLCLMLVDQPHLLLTQLSCPQLRTLALRDVELSDADVVVFLKTVFHFPALTTLCLDVETLLPISWPETPPRELMPIHTLALNAATIMSSIPRFKIPLSNLMLAFPKLATLILVDMSLLAYITPSRKKPLTELRILSSAGLSEDFKSLSSFGGAVHSFIDGLDFRHLHLGDCGEGDSTWPFQSERWIVKADLYFFLDLLHEDCCEGLESLTIHNTQLSYELLNFLEGWADTRWQPATSDPPLGDRLHFHNCTFGGAGRDRLRYSWTYRTQSRETELERNMNHEFTTNTIAR